MRSGDLRARPHPIKFPTCAKDLKNLLGSEGNQQQKLTQMGLKEGNKFKLQNLAASAICF